MTAQAPAPDGAQQLPRLFGRYALFDRIGQGGMAEIFLARARTELGGARLVVVKQILPELADNPRFAELLVTEAKLAARLGHANVVQVTDLGRHEGRLYIAMEYVEGFDLNDLLRRCSRTRTPMPFEFALLIVTEALRGLDYAHRQRDESGRPIGLVHRDVSPSNILVSFEGEVKLCDFGIAHATFAAAEVGGAAASDLIQGKAGYMSPEQARGDALDARADVFAAGIILWELFAGQRYYKAPEGSSPLALAKQAPYRDPPARGLPHEASLVAILRRALAPAAADRFPSAQAFLRELEGFTAGSGLLASPLRLGAWLRDTFGAETLERRRERERASRAIEAGPMVVLERVSLPQISGPTQPAAATPPAPGALPLLRQAQQRSNSTPPPRPDAVAPRPGLEPPPRGAEVEPSGGANEGRAGPGAPAAPLEPAAKAGRRSPGATASGGGLDDDPDLQALRRPRRGVWLLLALVAALIAAGAYRLMAP